jgi:hypothetical protein
LAAGGWRIDGAVVIKMDGSDVVVSPRGIKQRGKKPHLGNDMPYPVLGEVLKNAISANELSPRSGEKKDLQVNNTFVLFQAFAYKNKICPARIQFKLWRSFSKNDKKMRLPFDGFRQNTDCTKKRPKGMSHHKGCENRVKSESTT